MLLTLLATAFATPAPASSRTPAPQAPDAIPFEALGEELLESAQGSDEIGGLARDDEGRLYARLAPLHERLPLGAIELWIPRRTLRSPGRLVRGPSAKDTRPWARALLDLQRAWPTRRGADARDAAACSAALDELETWVKGFRQRTFPPATDTVHDARRVLEDRLRTRRATIEDEAGARVRPLVVVLCPTRAHYVAMYGAVGIVLPRRQAQFWTDTNARTGNAFPTFGLTFVPLTWGPATGPPLQNLRAKPAESLQQIVHVASFLLTYDTAPNVPTWFAEGVAINDTIRVCGADETVFSGHRDRSWKPGLETISSLFRWVTRDASPYRDGPSKGYFVRSLREAWRKNGFAIEDLDRSKTALRLGGPFLGVDAAAPAAMHDAADGVKHGFAEFFRAYSAAFVHWLGTEEVGDDGRSRLDALFTALAAIESSVEGSPLRPFGPATERAFGRTLGASLAAEDLEGEFQAWLTGAAPIATGGDLRARRGGDREDAHRGQRVAQRSGERIAQRVADER